jgi:hypothetical protein
MRKPMNWLLTAAIGLGGAALAGCDRNDPAKQASNDAQDKKVINNKRDAASPPAAPAPVVAAPAPEQKVDGPANLLDEVTGGGAKPAAPKGADKPLKY